MNHAQTIPTNSKTNIPLLLYAIDEACGREVGKVVVMWYIVSFIAGAIMGALMICLCVVAADADRRIK